MHSQNTSNNYQIKHSDKSRFIEESQKTTAQREHTDIRQDPNNLKLDKKKAQKENRSRNKTYKIKTRHKKPITFNPNERVA